MATKEIIYVKNLQEIEIDNDIVDQYFNTNSGYTVDYGDKVYTTKKNSDLINSIICQIDEDEEQELIDAEFHKDFDDLHHQVIDPDFDDNKIFLTSRW